MVKPFRFRARICRGVSWLLGAAAAIGSAAGCSDDGAPREVLVADAGPADAAGPALSEPDASAGGGGQVCEPGATRACELDLLCSGVAACAPDGRGFGACECSTAALVGSGVVGASCEADADCAGGATCLTEAGTRWRGLAGGPAGGYCSFPCTTTAECTERDAQSRCLPFSEELGSYCIRSCLSKQPEPDEAKCLNRPDLACVSGAAQGLELVSSERQEGYCGPLCGSDSDCGEGRVCHRAAGLCTASPAPGEPIGSRCNVDRDCDGDSCEDRDAENIGVCTALCVLGSLDGCGYAADANPREAACLTPLVAAGRFSEGSGDVGLCRELCDVAADCQRAGEGWICSPLTEALASFVGRSGACAAPE